MGTLPRKSRPGFAVSRPPQPNSASASYLAMKANAPLLQGNVSLSVEVDEIAARRRHERPEHRLRHCRRDRAHAAVEKAPPSVRPRALLAEFKMPAVDGSPAPNIPPRSRENHSVDNPNRPSDMRSRTEGSLPISPNACACRGTGANHRYTQTGSSFFGHMKDRETPVAAEVVVERESIPVARPRSQPIRRGERRRSAGAARRMFECVRD